MFENLIGGKVQKQNMQLIKYRTDIMKQKKKKR